MTNLEVYVRETGIALFVAFMATVIIVLALTAFSSLLVWCCREMKYMWKCSRSHFWSVIAVIIAALAIYITVYRHIRPLIQIPNAVSAEIDL